MATQANFSFYRGEDVLVTVTMNPVVDITGWHITFTVLQTPGDLPILITKTVGAGITLTNPVGGVFTIQINSADTAGFVPGDYHFDIQRTDTGFDTVLTIGTLTLLQAARTIPLP